MCSLGISTVFIIEIGLLMVREFIRYWSSKVRELGFNFSVRILLATLQSGVPAGTASRRQQYRQLTPAVSPVVANSIASCRQ